MTRLRHALVLFSVMVFALALGVALGGGPLQGQVRGAIRSQLVADPGTDAARAAALARRNRDLARSARFEDGFAQSVSADLLGGALADRPVAVLSLPGVTRPTTEAVVADIGAAGGSVTTALRVGPDLVAPSARPLVDELTRRLLPELDDVDVPEGTSVYTRVGAVVSRALLTTEDGGLPMGDAARSVFNTFTTAGLLRGAEPQQRASAVVVLVPAPPQRGASTSGRSTIVTELVVAMDEAGDGVVVAGPPSAAERDGLLSAVRASPTTGEDVSTVDTVGRRAGQVVTVLALAGEVDGDAGHYGVGRGADALVP